jgi:hypothetical protein
MVILTLLCVTTYIGCQKSETSILDGTVTQTQIKTLLVEQLSLDDKSIRLLDANYNILNKEWLYSATASEFPFFIKSLGIYGYKSEISDCDKYSKAYSVWLTSKIRKETTSNIAPAVGMISYVSESMGGSSGTYTMHEINVVVVREIDKTLRLVFIEPQRSAPIGLTASEKSMASFVVF